MSTLVTEALVLHAFDYLETSRIIRLMTRDAGVQSVIARGARNSRKRFGSAVDLFAQGTAEIQMRDQRDLQVLLSLDVTRGRPQFARDVGRFTAGSMIAELALRAASDEPTPVLFDAVELALDNLAVATPDQSVGAGLAGAWQIVSALGFTPALDVCANCHADLDPGSTVAFAHTAGGALCPRCGQLAAGARTLPAAARNVLRSWLNSDSESTLSPQEARAHQRLLREFFLEHIAGDRELKAFGVWEHGAWTAA